MRMRHIIIFVLSSCTIFFFTLPYEQHDIVEMKIVGYKMRVLIFSAPSVWNISCSEKKWAKCEHKYAHTSVFMQSAGYNCQILKKREFFWQIFEEYENTKFRENSSIGNKVVFMRTGGQTWRN